MMTNMRAISGILGLVLVLAIVYFVYTTQFSGEKGNLPPKQRIDLTAVRTDLLSLAQAEKRYLAANGSYATLEQLQQEGSAQFQGTGRRGYSFTIETDAAEHFRITARPVDPARTDWPTLSIDETMQVATTDARKTE